MTATPSLRVSVPGICEAGPGGLWRESVHVSSVRLLDSTCCSIDSFYSVTLLIPVLAWIALVYPAFQAAREL